jgi:serine/threonine protein kinase
VAGDFAAAQQDFQKVATLVADTAGQAEAHYNTYRAALEQKAWDTALKALLQAIRLDSKRFASYPVEKYSPQRILGAGGFGVALLCKHKYMDAQVVVKTLTHEEIGRAADKVFSEAQLLRQLEHPAIIRIADCGFMDEAARAKPFLVMDYFESQTLEAHVQQHGPMHLDDCLAVAQQVAQGLQAAHANGILHRDVKPANLLVRQDHGAWKVKIIDFGLALKQEFIADNAQTSKPRDTVVNSSVAGTLDYAAPEQMGRRKEPVGPYSDIFGFARTCSYALFQTTQPLFKHWQRIPLPLAQLLEQCLEEDPFKRPQSFTLVLQKLDGLHAAPVGPPARGRPRAEPILPTLEEAPFEAAELAMSVAELVPPVVAVRPAPRSHPEKPFSDRNESAVAESRTQQVQSLLALPAMALLCSGILGALGNVVFAIYGLLNNEVTHELDVTAAVSTTLVLLVCAAISVIPILGGVCMMKQRVYWLALVGSIAAIAGMCVCGIVGVPIGIWSLMVLHKPEVRSAFR